MHATTRRRLHLFAALAAVAGLSACRNDPPRQGQAIYYDGHHTGHVLTVDQGRADAATWADYINVGMEHGAFDMAGLAAYMQGLAAVAPTRSRSRQTTTATAGPTSR